MYRLLALLMMLYLWLPTTVWAEFYKYKDPNGTWHFTDNIAEVPEDQRPQMESYIGQEDLVAPEEKRQKVLTEDPGRQKAQVDKIKRIEVKQERTQVAAKKLSREKTALDKEYADLMKEKKNLIREGNSITDPAQLEDFNEAVINLNEKITEFENRRLEFKKKADAFNAGKEIN
jgi:hypothetical protein